MKTSARTPLVAGLLLGCGGTALAAPEHSASDFGGIGLLQVPTARFGEDGEFRAGISSVSPYNQILLGLQLLPWMETGFRYVEVTNRLYGPEFFSGDQTYKDRGVDLKLRLLREGHHWPAVALGMRDIGGTGLFAGEYLVASRRYYDWDFTLGIGWGRIADDGGIGNPFSVLSDGFEERDMTSEPGGLGLDRMFRGKEVGLFGGLQWQTPMRHLSLKLEYDANDYDLEAQDNVQADHSPVNAALNLRLWDAVDLSAGVERGDTFMFRIAAFTNFMTNHGPAKVFDPPTSPANVVAAAAAGEPLAPAPRADAEFVKRLKAELARQSIHAHAVDPDPKRGLVTVWFSQNLTRDQQRAVGRVGQTLATLAPADYTAFTMVHVAADVETYRVTLFRREIADAIEYRGSTEEIAASALIDPLLRPAYAGAEFAGFAEYPSFSWGMGPALRQHVGGPDDFYFGQLWWRTSASVAVSPRWSFTGVVGANLYNNFDGLEVRETSVLPNVRSDVVRYLQEGENNLVRLETNYVWSPASNWWARLSGGIFEEMFGGVASELLYRKPYSAWAVGVNLDWVRQRDYDQRFRFLDYDVVTGHLTGYFDLPFYNLHVNLSAGRYLAGDVGGTLELSRRFDSGVIAGAFATKTDVSSEDFGEGKFDKGFFVYIPLDLFFPKSSRRGANLGFRPLTRDGGQKVRDGASLYGLTEGSWFDRDAQWDGALR